MHYRPGHYQVVDKLQLLARTDVQYACILKNKCNSAGTGVIWGGAQVLCKHRELWEPHDQSETQCLHLAGPGLTISHQC